MDYINYKPLTFRLVYVFHFELLIISMKSSNEIKTLNVCPPVSANMAWKEEDVEGDGSHVTTLTLFLLLIISQRELRGRARYLPWGHIFFYVDAFNGGAVLLFKQDFGSGK